MKFLYISRSGSRFKEYNFSKPLIIISLLSLTTLFIFLGYKISDYSYYAQSKEKAERYKKLYKTAISDSKADLKSIENQIEKLTSKDNLLRLMIGLPEIPKDVRKMGTGGESDYLDELNHLFDEDNLGDDINNFVNDVSYLSKITELQKISYSDISNYVDENLNKILRIPAIHPIPLEEGEKTSGFGMRRDPYTRKNRMHEGQDFSGVWAKTPVLATAKGVIKSAGKYGTYGNYIEIDHGNGIITIYAHLHRIYVRKGDRVQRGQKIGTLGNTGRSTAPHLHYEIKKFGKPINPENYLLKNLDFFKL